MAPLDFLRRLRPGRRRNEPLRDTQVYPIWPGRSSSNSRPALKPTPANLRAFGRTPYARRAINAIKNPIAMMEWEVAPVRDVELSSELQRQIDVTTACLDRPNNDDSFRSLIEQTLEDVLCGAGAIEHQLSGDPLRPLWLFPVDGLSIQIYPGWAGDPAEARYAQMLGYGGWGTRVVAQLRNDELIYLKPNPSTATPFGLGPLEVAFNSISRLLGVGDFAGNVSSNQRPSILLDMGEGAAAEAISAFRAYWTSEIEGQGKMPIAATKGGKVHRLYPEGDAGLFLLYQEFLKAEIAVAFDLSPMTLGVERDVNRNTAEVMAGRDLDHAVKPMATLVASAITREAIQGRLGFSQLRLRFPELEAEDEAVLSESYARDYEHNAVTPNEYRKRRGLPPTVSVYGDMLKCEADIAIQAAKGAGEVRDPNLPKPATPAKPKKEA